MICKKDLKMASSQKHTIYEVYEIVPNGTQYKIKKVDKFYDDATFVSAMNAYIRRTHPSCGWMDLSLLLLTYKSQDLFVASDERLANYYEFFSPYFVMCSQQMDVMHVEETYTSQKRQRTE
jgi:hypothetical protein